MADIFDFTDTWNNGATTFDAIACNVTDTASAAASRLIRMRVGSVEKFTVDKDGDVYAAGNVGIGTTTAIGSSTLSVLDASGNAQIAFGYSGSGYTRFFGDASNNCYIQPGGATAMTLLSGGNVGIGTASPGAPLHIDSPGGDVGLILDSTSGGSYEGILFRVAGVNKGYLGQDNSTFYMGAPSALSFRTGSGAMVGGTDRLTISSGGDVGIGTTTPGEKLEVYGNVKLKNATITTGVRALTPTGFGYDQNVYRVVQVGAASGNETVAIGYNPSVNAGSAFSGNGIEVVFRNGVEFTTPNSANTAWHRYNLVLKDGLVGIGTSTPGALLAVNGTGTVSRWSDDGTTTQLDIDISSGNYGLIGTNTNHYLALQANNGIKMAILPSGNVGIGTTTPAYPIELQNNSAVTGAIVESMAIHQRTTGTPTAGFGARLKFILEDAGGGVIDAGGLKTQWISATAGAATSKTTIQAASAGTAVDVASFLHTGEIEMDRTTADAAYINFKATADADATSAISTLTTSGSTTHHIQIEINGVTAWIAASTTDPS